MKVLQFVAAILALSALPVAAMAQPPDFGRFLEGRWGHVDAEWKDQPVDWLYAPCRAGHPRADAAYTFSGKSDALMVRSYGPQSASSFKAVDSPVLIAGQADPAAMRAKLWDQSATAKLLAEASFAVLVGFEERGTMSDRDKFTGVLAVLGEDRIALIEWDERNNSFSTSPDRLVRCNGR